MNFGDIVKPWLSRKEATVKPSTYAVYTCAVFQFLLQKFGDMELDRIDADVAAFLGIDKRTLQRRILRPVPGEIDPNDARPVTIGSRRLWRREDVERRARDQQGAEARVERRLMDEDAAYRLCRRASRAVFALPKEEAR